MATKDYVYLALIAFSGLVFYLHGYYAGVVSRRARARHLAADHSSSLPLPEAAVFTVTVEDVHDVRPQHTHRFRESVVQPTIQCIFGNN